MTASPNEMTKFIKYLMWGDKIIASGAETIIIAGDISNFNQIAINALIIFKKHYKNVIYVLGNHEFYLIPHSLNNSFSNSLEKVDTLRILCKEEGISLLEGDIIEIDGVKIGGTHMWYDGHYSRKNHGMTDDQFYRMWNSSMNDAKFITPNLIREDWQGEQIKLLEKIYRKVDVMVTHVGPAVHSLPLEYRSPMTGCFYFDGERFITPNIKVWIFGHTHLSYCFQHKETDLFCNPVGYPSENRNVTVEMFEI